MGGLSPLPLVQGGPAPAGRPRQIPPVPSTLYVLGVVLGGLSPEDQPPFNGGGHRGPRGELKLPTVGANMALLPSSGVFCGHQGPRARLAAAAPPQHTYRRQSRTSPITGYPSEEGSCQPPPHPSRVTPDSEPQCTCSLEA